MTWLCYWEKRCESQEEQQKELRGWRLSEGKGWVLGDKVRAETLCKWYRERRERDSREVAPWELVEGRGNQT